MHELVLRRHDTHYQPNLSTSQHKSLSLSSMHHSMRVNMFHRRPLMKEKTSLASPEVSCKPPPCGTSWRQQINVGIVLKRPDYSSPAYRSHRTGQPDPGLGTYYYVSGCWCTSTEVPLLLKKWLYMETIVFFSDTKSRGTLPPRSPKLDTHFICNMKVICLESLLIQPSAEKFPTKNRHSRMLFKPGSRNDSNASTLIWEHQVQFPVANREDGGAISPKKNNDSCAQHSHTGITQRPPFCEQGCPPFSAGSWGQLTTCSATENPEVELHMRSAWN